jgi:hypothetical protein
MMKTLKVGSWVSISEGCPISHDVHGSDSVTFLYGPATDGFEFVMDAEALRDHLRHGAAALVEMDTLADREDRSLG